MIMPKSQLRPRPMLRLKEVTVLKSDSNDMRDEVKAGGEVRRVAVLCPKAIPVGDKITVSNRFPSRAPPPQQGLPSGAGNALVYVVSFTGHLSSA